MTACNSNQLCIFHIDDICNSYCQSQISVFVGENYSHAKGQR
jgi:hypothetical protein